MSRGVDKRKIFMDDRDRFRFIHDLFEFNDEAPAGHTVYYLKFSQQSADIASRQIENRKRKPRKLLVDILAFCLMPNHYHLLLRPRNGNAVPKFMKKLNIGYAKYFNIKYKRTGALFEGRYKSVLVKNHAHFVHLPYYIHLNPLDLVAPEWRRGKLNDCKKAIKFLESYRWSSHLDYLGKKNFPSVTRREFLLKFFGGENKYGVAIKDWLKDLEDLPREILLEE